MPSLPGERERERERERDRQTDRQTDRMNERTKERRESNVIPLYWEQRVHNARTLSTPLRSAHLTALVTPCTSSFSSSSLLSSVASRCSSSSALRTRRPAPAAYGTSSLHIWRRHGRRRQENAASERSGDNHRPVKSTSLPTPTENATQVRMTRPLLTMDQTPSSRSLLCR